MSTAPDVIPEGEEPPPPGTRIMAVVRWMLLAAMAAVAVGSAWKFWWEPRGAASSAARTFQCPMHPQVVADQPSACPICGMDLVEVKKHAEEKWQCPMHPQVVDSRNSKCPICGMDLVKVEVAAASHGHNPELPELTTVAIPGERVQRMGVSTAPVQKRTLADRVTTTGSLVPVESRTAQVHTRFAGWIEELLVRETGAPVKAGDPLVRIYSPEVTQALQELHSAQAIDGEDPLNAQLVKGAEKRLRLLGVAPDEVTENATGRPTVTLRAPRDGFVTQKNAIDGLYVQPGTALFEISDLSTVWLLVDLREDALGRVTTGQKATARFPALPGQSVQGRVTYLYPAMDPVTRTLKARIELSNPRGLLRPGLSATVDIMVDAARGLTAPVDAVVQTGKVAYVFVKTGEGQFEPRRVTVGVSTPEWVEIRGGVAENDEVVLGALFLIDSESRLRASLQSSTASGGAP